MTEQLACAVVRFNSHQEAGHAFAVDDCGRCLICVDCDGRRIGENVVIIKAQQMGLLRTGDLLVQGPLPAEQHGIKVAARRATPERLAARQARAAEQQPPDPLGLLRRRPPPLQSLGRLPRAQR